MGQLDSRPDGVDVDPADRHDQDSYPKAEQALTRQRVPILIHADNPHERLFIAALDGTGNSMSKDAPENWSAVARIAADRDFRTVQHWSRLRRRHLHPGQSDHTLCRWHNRLYVRAARGDGVRSILQAGQNMAQ